MLTDGVVPGEVQFAKEAELRSWLSGCMCTQAVIAFIFTSLSALTYMIFMGHGFISRTGPSFFRQALFSKISVHKMPSIHSSKRKLPYFESLIDSPEMSKFILSWTKEDEISCSFLLFSLFLPTRF